MKGKMSQHPRTRVTSSQVAKLAGVSRTTVSFVLNNVPHMGISDETRERVLNAARQLGYVPNAAARSLVSGATGTVAIVVPHSERLYGYSDAMHEFGVEVAAARVGFANFSAQSGYDAMNAMLERDRTLTALFAGNDTIAFGAMAALRDAGLRIPHDIAVVGYDDIPLAAYAAPPLTTMRTSPYEQACEAAQLLLRLIAGERPAQLHTMNPVPLVLRKSCGSAIPDTKRQRDVPQDE
jgi:DNA-binding LacI/PurR family transcriptional regulator